MEGYRNQMDWNNDEKSNLKERKIHSSPFKGTFMTHSKNESVVE